MARPRAAGYDGQREAILAQAARLFAAQGYPSTTMNQVAGALGLSKASLYHYFRDKDQLLVEIAEGHVEQLVALVEDVKAQAARPGADLSPQALVRALIERIVAEYADASDAHRVLSDEVRYLSDADRARILGRQREIVAGFADAIAQWQPAQARAGMAKPLTMLLLGMVNWLFTWMRADGPLSHADLAPIVADLFIGGVPCVQPPAPPSGD